MQNRQCDFENFYSHANQTIQPYLSQNDTLNSGINLIDIDIRGCDMSANKSFFIQSSICHQLIHIRKLLLFIE